MLFCPDVSNMPVECLKHLKILLNIRVVIVVPVCYELIAMFIWVWLMIF